MHGPAGVVEALRVAHGSHVDLGKVEPASTPHAPGDRPTTEAAVAPLHVELATWQDRLWAEERRSLLVILQGLDASGKDGTVKHVFGGVNPEAVSVTAFKMPDPTESAHDFLWRAHRAAPAAGTIAIWNRSHYEDVLAARVTGIVPETVWRGRYDLINAFESILAHGGTAVVKFFLHISPDEQRRRFEERLADPTKRWKFRAGDLEVRRHWGAYRQAYEDALVRTSTPQAPWYVIPADHKWYRNWAVSTVLVETLRNLAPAYPASPDEGPPPAVPDVR